MSTPVSQQFRCDARAVRRCDNSYNVDAMGYVYQRPFGNYGKSIHFKSKSEHVVRWQHSHFQSS